MLRQKWTIAVSIFGLCLLTTPFAQELETSIIDKHSCTSKESCGACIQTIGCAWCSKPEELDSSSQMIRCRPHSLDEDLEETNHTESGREERSSDSKSWCPLEHIVMPSSTMDIIDNEDLKPASKKGEKDASDAVQIRPQKVKLKLRVGESFPLKLQYAQAEDYPVDLYYLMDLSASMADDKESLSKLGDALAKEMNKLTSNFRLGFGSFVDKREMPFVSTVPAKLKKPCDVPGTGEPCAPPYGFINHMPLSLNTSQFRMEVNKARVSGNLDSPEGGLDALMQVIVCQKEIGWREKARRIIILSTDATFHLAGDGKLAGIVEPNDCHCHLDKNMHYTHGEILDYPSISQINRKAHENNMIIIFAVSQKQNDVYKALASRITGASSGTLKDDSSNVVKLVSDQYSKLVKSVILSDDAPSHVEVRYYSSCLNKTSQIYETRECGGLRVKDEVEFQVMIRVLRCPENEFLRKQTFHIKPQGLSEVVEVELEIICNCPCESDGYVVKSPDCSKSGTLQCGVCICDEGYVGNQCQCDRDSLSGTKADDNAGCIPGGNVTDARAVVCSNLGQCKCGVCDCATRDNPDEKISGKYCECNNFSCTRSGGKVCSGPEHGTCKCGECECNTGWKGQACECRNSNDSCITSGSSSGESEVCSGHGECVCGQCHCDIKGETRYSGKYCEECPTCTGRCKELGNCVECQVFGTGSVEECNKCEFKVIVVDTLSKDKSSNENDLSDEPDEAEDNDTEGEEEGPVGEVKHCSLPDHADCTFSFNYRYGKDKSLIVTAQRKKQCAPPVDILGVVLSVIGSIVLAGLVLLLVWKLLTNIHDRREFVRFEKERQMAKWDKGENPLYQKATTSFHNPTFGK